MALRKHVLKKAVASLTLMAIIGMGLPVNAQLGDQLLKNGSNNNDVKVLQQHLKNLGHMDYKGSTTYYGDITENAVKSFQRANGLKADGYFGPNTSKTLLNKVGSSKTPSSSIKSSSKSSGSLFTYKRALRYGSRGSDVRSLQKSLKTLGHYNSGIDGHYGPGTRNGVKRFQKSRGISVDGSFGPNSYRHLKSALNGSSSKPAPSKPSTSNSSGHLSYKRALTYGSRGSDVSSLQSALKKIKYYNSGIDGHYGPGTRRAVLNFQSDARISVDGSVGPNTVKHINKALNGNLPNRGSSNTSNSSSRSKLTQNIIREGKKYMGVPYVYGGSTPRGFDCTGYTQYVYKKFGVRLSRTSRAQATDGAKVSRSNLQPGDLVIFSGTYRPGPSHAGIYLGNDKFLHASSSKGVTVGDLDTKYWRSHYSYGRRVY